MTLRSKPIGGKLKRLKSVDTRASYVVADIDATSSFGTKMRIEKVGGNSKGLLSVASDTCASVRKRISGLVFYRLKIRSKTANVAEFNGEKCEGGVKTHRVDIRRAVRPGDIYGSLPRREGWCRSRHI